MSTLVIHGTMTLAGAPSQSWWWNSWGRNGFLSAVRRGLLDGRAVDDLWRVGGTPVAEIADLVARSKGHATHRGHFCWSGVNQPELREHAGRELASYLNALYRLAPGEPMRIVAHSHGANVVKYCSSSSELDPKIRISRAVFLACPHFTNPTERKRFPFRLDPARFGRVLNLFTKRDAVQGRIAEALPTAWGGGLYDWAPTAAPIDPDPAAAAVYENQAVETTDDGVKAHTAMHGATIGYLVGLWLGTRSDFRSILGRHGTGLPVPRSDFGA